MGNRFVATAKAESAKTKTENGADAYNTTGNSLVDLFGVIGSLRGQDTNRITKLFADAYAENALLATKMAFYARNVRGGLGERETFRTILKHMAQTNPQVVLNNLQNIAHFGRWDDLYVLVGTSLEDAIWATIRAQFILDAQAFSKGQSISIMAKWLKSVNTSSAESRMLGKKTAKALGLTEADYRKTLAKLRAYIEVVEQKMSAKQWDEIDYEGVPSRAMAIYRNAFKRHGMQTFEKFVDAVEKGEATIKAATLYPYDIFEKMGFDIGGWGNSTARFTHYDRVLEAQWKALPNYVGDGANFLVMADTSGSMSGRPVCTSVGLATYFAERNHGAFKDMFMTFSSRPKFVTLKGNTLFDKIKSVPSIVENTNLEAAFELVLNTAIQGRVPAEDMPKAIVVISDGEIDSFMNPGYGRYGKAPFGFLEVMRKKFRQYGYELPNIVMWNVASRDNRYLAQTDFQGVQFASGANPSVFKSLITNMGKSAYDAMVETLSDPMYDCVTL